MKRIRRTLIVIAMAALAAGVLASPASAFVNYGFSFSFGSAGSGNGQFKEPTAIDTDSAGNVWVADRGNGRIQKFNSKGEYLTQITKGIYGVEPTDIAVDSKGNLWEVEWSGDRVVQFSPEGTFIREFGESGSGNGQFWFPARIAIDSKDNIWIVDTSNYRIQKFNSEGKFLTKAGTEGTGNGQFTYPVGIATDSADNVWVADWQSEGGRIEKFNSSGSYLGKIAQGQISEPVEDPLTIDSKGNIWISDSAHGSLKVFTAAGTQLAEFGKSGSVGPLFPPRSLAFDPSGNPWILRPSQVEKWLPLPPTATTGAVTSVKDTEATLNATINPQGTSTTYQFQYGPTKFYGSKAPATPQSVGAGISALPVKTTISGLTANTTYHYRVIATSAAGTVNSVDKTFLTPPPNAQHWYVGGVKLAESTPAELWLKGAANYTLRWKSGTESFATTCTGQKEVASIENPASGFPATIGTSGFVVLGCTLSESTGLGCKLLSTSAATVKGVATQVEGKPAVYYTPTKGEDLFAMNLSECTNPLLNKTYMFAGGSFTGIANNATSTLEFTTAGSAMTSGGLPATIEGTSKMETTAGKLLTLAP